MLVTGFESFDLALYRAVSREVELMLEPASVDILVFSGRDVFGDRKSQLEVSYLSLSPWPSISPSPSPGGDLKIEMKLDGDIQSVTRVLDDIT